MSEETPTPILKIFVTEESFGFETELSPEETVFWLEVVKASILNRVVGDDDTE